MSLETLSLAIMLEAAGRHALSYYPAERTDYLPGKVLNKPYYAEWSVEQLHAAIRLLHCQAALDRRDLDTYCREARRWQERATALAMVAPPKAPARKGRRTLHDDAVDEAIVWAASHRHQNPDPHYGVVLFR